MPWRDGTPVPVVVKADEKWAKNPDLADRLTTIQCIEVDSLLDKLAAGKRAKVFMAVPLSRGLFAFVDAKDSKDVGRWLWSTSSPRRYTGGFYARRNFGPDAEGQQYKSMHLYLMNPPAGMEVDHKNGEGLDNRRSNLRVCPHNHNMRNMRRWTKKSSKYKGVSWFKRDSRWRAYIVDANRQFHLGYFDDEVTAAETYDRAAKEMFGEYACLNFPAAKRRRKDESSAENVLAA